MQPFEEALTALEEEFAGDNDVLEVVNTETLLVRRWVTRTAADLEERRDGREPYDRQESEDDEYNPEFHSSAERMEERSIFDDVDA
jgi:hypothetical protein